jgi:hypothetical protein
MMWFAVVVSGLGAFGVAAAYAFRPTEGKLMLMRPLSLASVFSAIGSLTAGMATILKGIAASGDFGGHIPSAVFHGCAEVLIPVFAAFSFLAVAWLLVAVGMRRQSWGAPRAAADADGAEPPQDASASPASSPDKG